MTVAEEITGRGVVPGRAEAPALVSPVPVSFLGDVDIGTGRIVGTDSPVCGETVAGRVLVMPHAVGSAGVWRFVYQLWVHGTHPAGIVIGGPPDSSLVQGALLSEIPVLAHAGDVVARVSSGDLVVLDATAGRLLLGGQG